MPAATSFKHVSPTSAAVGIKMDEKKLSFEEAYKQLMELVKKMESGELPLADSVAAYEQGIKLKAYCEQLLKEAELKIETLKVSA